jgi:hypothetical protein
LPINLRAVAVILGLLALPASACGLLELLFLLQKKAAELVPADHHIRSPQYFLGKK